MNSHSSIFAVEPVPPVAAETETAINAAVAVLVQEANHHRRAAQALDDIVDAVRARTGKMIVQLG